EIPAGALLDLAGHQSATDIGHPIGEPDLIGGLLGGHRCSRWWAGTGRQGVVPRCVLSPPAQCTGYEGLNLRDHIPRRPALRLGRCPIRYGPRDTATLGYPRTPGTRSDHASPVARPTVASALSSAHADAPRSLRARWGRACLHTPSAPRDRGTLILPATVVPR